MDYTKHRQALIDLRWQYVGLLDGTIDRNRAETQSADSAVDSDIPTHEADAASVMFDRERDSAFVDDYKGMIEQIDRALAKMADGSYGRCERCGRIISKDRLDAMPMALLCLEDEEGQEATV